MFLTWRGLSRARTRTAPYTTPIPSPPLCLLLPSHKAMWQIRSMSEQEVVGSHVPGTRKFLLSIRQWMGVVDRAGKVRGGRKKGLSCAFRVPWYSEPLTIYPSTEIFLSCNSPIGWWGIYRYTTYIHLHTERAKGRRWMAWTVCLAGRTMSFSALFVI